MKWLVLIVFVATCLYCSNVKNVAGGSSDSGNPRIMGRVLDSNGVAAAHALVRIRKSDYCTQAPWEEKSYGYEHADIQTGIDGRFTLDSLSLGKYCIEVFDADSNAVLFRCTINSTISQVRLLDDTLKPMGTIAGITTVPLGVSKSTCIQFPGLERLSMVDTTTGNFTVKLPRGAYSLRYFTSASSDSARIIEPVYVSPNITNNIVSNPWKYSQVIHMNTTSSGALISQDVYHFPVLIRLTKNNFDFAQTHGRGVDLRFTKSDSITPIYYEIERFDPLLQLAEIWVNIDTINSNNNSQSIIMHWGNPNALDASNSTRVFDTSNYYRGVWHLGESSSTIWDATFDKYNGIRNGKAAQTNGAIGYGQVFSDSGDCIDMGKVLNPGTNNFTVSAWVKRSGKGLHTIIGKSDGGDPSATYGWNLGFDLTDQLHFFVGTGGTVWGDTGSFHFLAVSADTDFVTWNYVTAVCDRSGNNSCKLYRDGLEIGTYIGGDISSVGTIINQASLRIGLEGDGGYQYHGSIDECVVSYTVRSADWIRLCFMNQGSDDKLILFK